MIHRLLVANRGEIASRIIATARRLGIETILAASEVDLDSPAARLADRVVRLGPSAPSKSYLDVDAVIAAARSARADALHPGYGFLSEQPGLARACAKAGIVFVGPSAEHLEALGDKLRARALAAEAALPLLAGGAVADEAATAQVLDATGFPVLVKAVGGGGGRGMRLVEGREDLAAALEASMAEAGGAFGDARVYLEAYVASARHVEVQLIGDGERIVHLGERDCSVQRRYQKLVEEAPAPELPQLLREAMHEAALRLGRHLGYASLGTVEFLVDVERGSFFFLEVNPRIQVEHPVTEMTTGLDLVALQLGLADGERLHLTQDEVRLSGHAIECRINAEDPDRAFCPAPGRVSHVELPVGPGVRVDAALQSNSTVAPHYDSLVAKVIAHGPSRAVALQRLSDALGRCRFEGISTTVGLHQAILADPAFARGGVDTAFLPRLLEEREERRHGLEAAHG